MGDSSDWFPFKQKDIMIGCLIAGCPCTIMSRKTYNHIQVVLRMCDIELPSWKTVQTAKTKLQKKSHCKKSSSQSILGNPMTTELCNPIVTNYLEYYPEDSEGENIYKLSQSQKWLHQYPRDLHAQMIRVENKSFYIYEPAQIIDRNVVVPI
ncbi:hypothetical protein BY996DRAFT_4576201 [Phakopsora pachyrhizi]|uniref:Uncharacterized protein n=1 Tax=Phakopsora pachyrhizi TaxID=170000 RepID=A0AAV0BH87_PHAPC|nr:hypothetical protein BY996DRAFT_4576201 [Phakopsora pachyrhizi]CAH7685630.1 hypothetical protein PPACK8108_LOCUS20197 [Phakopsora pachyrhizi]